MKLHSKCKSIETNKSNAGKYSNGPCKDLTLTFAVEMGNFELFLNNKLLKQDLSSVVESSLISSVWGILRVINDMTPKSRYGL